jgi:hypothetical protein
MSQRSIQTASRGSMSSDTLVKSSSESEKKCREKYDEESLSSKKNPRVQSVESSSDTEPDTPSTEAEKGSKPRRSLREKIKKTWKNVKEKYSDKSSHIPKTKKSTPCEFKAYDPSLSLDDRTELWKENGKNLFGNIKTFKPDFKKSQGVITDLILKGSEDFAANEFNAADYAGLGFDFLSTMTDGALINPMNIFGSKSVITSTKTTAQELLADTEDAAIRPSYALNKPIKLCASGIGPALFSNQLLNILREIPLTCPVILDVSSNNLGPLELLELVRVMEEHPVIYSLDLGNNPICTDKSACFALINLFSALGPVSRLFLDNTGFNDNSAADIESSVEGNFCLRHLDLRGNKLTERGLHHMIFSTISHTLSYRQDDDSALRVMQLQNNIPNEWDPIITILNVAFCMARLTEENFVPRPTPIPVQIDIPDLYVQKLNFGEPYLSNIIRPQTNSTDDRL